MPSSLDFGGLDIRHDAYVLTPRPWTLAQSEWARRLLEDLPAGPVLELCAGVGHIGLAAVRGTDREIVLVDRDAHACELARINLAAAGTPGEVRHGTAASVVADDERYVLVIADPPWVPSAGTGQFEEDPVWAIDGGSDGLDVARECLGVMTGHLVPGGRGLLQLGTAEQAAALDPELAALGLDVRGSATFERGFLLLLERPAGSD